MAATIDNDAPALSPNTLHITIRFTTSIPDLLIDIPEPSKTTIISLKHLLRTKLDPQTSRHRFRLIYSGKLLRDDDILSLVLRVPTPPPRTPDPSSKGKGKEIDLPPLRVYINCSIGDVLTPSELAAEGVAAIESSKKLREESTSRGRDGAAKTGLDHGGLSVTTSASPRGFDRLLSAGFTTAEVNQLRLQFLSIQANIHTPDTMPSPTTLRQMEDAWIDNNAENSGTGEAFDFGDNGTGGGALDDLVWGNVIGFLWPLGCIGWVIREEGVWSTRRQIAVFTGFMLSLGLGILRVLS
ncbi:hypothetical protein OIDMADRAFT_27008 [Oidiodendron maius Zn]|uniref:Ubiquitin-like domain-containing protein n=1 Tax=Oidiodendron maius (strain Zn) TaxID=913774 RepID=A0A0C3DKI4_OIDMZ|nr:hypothetical protein OIDMADRAFT_27008 [Oidiodendron maius Zn]